MATRAVISTPSKVKNVADPFARMVATHITIKLYHRKDAKSAKIEFILFSVERTENNKFKPCSIQITAGEYTVFRRF